MFSIIYGIPPILFTNLFTNLRGSKGVGNVGRLQINIPLLHLHAAVAAGLHRDVESQFLGLVWCGGKIDHPNGEHDDYANGTAGALNLARKNQIFNPRAIPIGIGRGIRRRNPASGFWLQ
jgi:hypothetical protein